ncbi:RNA recognition motif domain-containing protein [Dioscorea alata]|uniref:RNA recognition motif domain-containing protein n=1 Tax=Dioscorea alata TaxID=55571 RepID=A0ACB7UN46_DIOAL|nr:RNA recognition motif domain-containing protein [Dioscorea alata]
MSSRGKRQRAATPPSIALRKRLRRPPATEAPDENDEGTAKRLPSSLVVVTGLPADCTVLELKSRMEMYGPVSRIRMDADGSGHVTFRSSTAAEAAVSAALNPDFGVLVRSQRVQVCRGTDPSVQWRIGVQVSSTSRLLRAEKPLSKYGRSNKKLDISAKTAPNTSELPSKGREIVAYDDLF